MKTNAWGLTLGFGLLATAVSAVNYDETKVGTFTLPDPLVMLNGQTVKDTNTWMTQRRPELLQLYQDHIYGHSPERPGGMTFNVWDTDRHALGGQAVRKQIEINFSGQPRGPFLHVLLYTPAGLDHPVPTFLYLQFDGNYRLTEDPAVAIFPVWDKKKKVLAMPKNPIRGGPKVWPLEDALARGYGIAAMDYNEIEPDLSDGAGGPYGVRALYPDQHGPADWGAIAAWAWGASRAMDYLETDRDVDAHRVIMLGMSRLGKTALWAGARDTRFALVIASCSGEMGASLARRDYGETVTTMCKGLSYQFCRNFLAYSNRIPDLPVDTHCLISLIAPRPVYLSTGSQDRWGDPRGEFEAALAAQPVYRLFGKEGLDPDLPPATAEGRSGTLMQSATLEAVPPPPLDVPIMRDIGYQTHKGGHALLNADWERFLDFADLHFYGKPPRAYSPAAAK